MLSRSCIFRWNSIGCTELPNWIFFSFSGVGNERCITTAVFVCFASLKADLEEESEINSFEVLIFFYHCRTHLGVARTHWLKMSFLLSKLMIQLHARSMIQDLSLSALFLSGR